MAPQDFNNVPPIIQDVMVFCTKCGATVWMTMVAYVDEITFRCKRNPKHVYRFTRADSLPDWAKPYTGSFGGGDQEDPPR